MPMLTVASAPCSTKIWEPAPLHGDTTVQATTTLHTQAPSTARAAHCCIRMTYNAGSWTSNSNSAQAHMHKGNTAAWPQHPCVAPLNQVGQAATLRARCLRVLASTPAAYLQRTCLGTPKSAIQRSPVEVRVTLHTPSPPWSKLSGSSLSGCSTEPFLVQCIQSSDSATAIAGSLDGAACSKSTKDYMKHALEIAHQLYGEARCHHCQRTG